ncbi:heat shock protein HslJ [Lewinella aquimaris]|uniref:Heat shock protein HslJ n=1 Tax=Neolewinella aquimaris TaxID=1835722 RepID=A0A840EE41_9BACT|nr:DUF4377 domain-containing protein [Neolewinella aquimaris]MBB4080069.1 heat shock protein HslJ [Neolewinella aquimaris]
MKPTVALLVIGFLILAVGGCTSTANRVINSTVSTFWINSRTVPCTGAGPQTCLQVKRGPELDGGEWEYFYATIAGFDYEPGYLYKLSVRETPLIDAEVPADGSSIEYTLIRVLEKNHDPALLLNDIWVLERIAGEAVDLTAATDLRQPTIEFQLAEQRVMGNNGCNSFNGTLQKAEQGNLRFGPLAMTRKACMNSDVPDRVTAALNRVAGYAIESLRLTLVDESGEELLQYRKVD